MKFGYKNTKLILLFLVILLILAMIFFIFSNDLTNYEQASYFIREYSFFGKILFISLYIIASVIMIPITPITIMGGVLIGAKYTIIYALIGSMIGSLIPFFVTKFIGETVLHKYIYKKYPNYKKIENLLENHGFYYVFIIRLIAFIPFSLINYLFGLTRVRTMSYVCGTFLGILPATIMYAFFGNTITDFSIFNITISILFVAILIITTFIYKKRYQ